jgi:uncharacterized phage protein (TIGR01671 family)
MNREVAFRGKRCSDGKWVYGFYVESKTSWRGHKPHKSWIVPDAISNGGFFNVLGRYAVKDDTVGQFTGLRDKNGKRVFEGDVVHVVWQDSMFCQWHERTVLVEFKYGRFTVYQSKPFEHSDKRYFEVIGNIYDNFDLMK